MTLDNFRTIELIWDKANKSIIKTIKTASSDTTGRYFSVKVLDEGQEVDLTGAKLQLYWEHPNFNTNGTDDFTTIDTKGLFKLTFSDEMLTNVGELNAHLVLILPDGKITSDGFPIEVIKGADGGVVVPTNGSGLVKQIDGKIDKGNVTLNDLTQEVKLAITGGAVAVVGENAVGTENIKDDSVTEGKIADSAIDYIKRVEIPLTLTNGYVTSSNNGNGEGQLVSHPSAGSYSQIFSILKGVKIQIHAGGGNTVSILSKWASNGVYQSQIIVGDGVTTDHYYTATEDIEYLRVTTLNAVVPSGEMYVAIVSNSMEIVAPINQKITDLSSEVDSVKNYYTPISFTTSNYYVASPNHTSMAEGTLAVHASYRLTNIITFKKGDVIRVTASTYASASVLTKWTDTGVYSSTVIIGDGVTMEYVYTVVDDVEYLRFSNNIQIVPEMKVELIQPIGTKIAELSGNQSVKVNFKPLTAEVRKPVVNIQFDDAALARDNSVAQKMEAKGWKAGFALLVSQLDTQDKVDSYLTLQSQGHEMLNHTRTQRNMSNPTVNITDVESEILGGFRDLRNFGFDIRGFVSPQSALDLSYFPILKKAHEYAYTVYNGLYDPATATLLPQNQYNDDPLKLWRMSIESTSFDNQKLAIDNLCDEGGMLTIYSHTITSDFDALLDYLKTKEDANLLEVKTPSECFDHFYKVNQTNLRDALS